MAVLRGIVNINSPMGANLMRTGVGFRCFAPNAHYVAVFAGAALAGAEAAAAAAGWLLPLMTGWRTSGIKVGVGTLMESEKAISTCSMSRAMMGPPAGSVIRMPEN